jgi:ribosomal protein S12 methylthiotransferase
MSNSVVKVGMISLGCAKNLVDAEIMLGGIRAEGMEIVNNETDADVLIVNTCAFIDSAKEESVQAILEAHQSRGLAKRRKGQRLVVSGCMSQRFSKELAVDLPEVDAFMGLDQVADAGRIIREMMERDELGTEERTPVDLVTKKPVYIPDWDTPRVRLTAGHTAYTKIAEGCNHPCSFCVIPQMRGRHRSRPIDSIVREVRELVGQGVKEINLISQDTTYYGMDGWDEKAGPRQPVDSRRGDSLVQLLHELGSIEGDFWIRLLYTHPAHWSDELIRAIAQNEKVCRYIDMPLQHIHPRLLKAMQRETSSEHIENLIDRIRAGIPGIAIRTTFIVGFPGETEEEFEYLIDFIERRRFERLGVFTYSQEEGSKAAKMEDQIPAKVRQKRYARAMKVQQRIAQEIASAQVGRVLRVLSETDSVARGPWDAPDIDGRVFIDRPVTPGAFLDVKVTKAQVYDLVATPI